MQTVQNLMLDVQELKRAKFDRQSILITNAADIDAAINLSRMGKKVTVLDEKENPDAKITDPSETLTPYTVDRLMDEIAYDRITLVADTKVDEIKFENDNYIITNERDDSTYTTKSKPILATGFVSSLSMVKDLFDWHPLVSGDTNTVHEANVSVKEKTIAEFEVDEDEWEDYLWDEEA
mgnify:CR=1 FL=1